MYQNPPRYAPGPPVHEAEPPPQRSLLMRLVFRFVVVAVAAFGISYGAMSEPEITVLPGITYADGAFQVPYERDGNRGLFQLLTQDGEQVRMASVDAVTGEVRSDTRLPGPPAAPASTPTATEVTLPGTREKVVLRELPFGMPGLELVHVTEDGRSRSMGGAMFQGVSLVSAAVPGHVLVQHQGAGIELSVVAVDTGLVTGTLTVEQPVTSAVAGQNSVVVTAGPALVMAHADGRLTRLTVGEVDFFGSVS
jgi:hypothetical protein